MSKNKGFLVTKLILSLSRSWRTFQFVSNALLQSSTESIFQQYERRMMTGGPSIALVETIGTSSFSKNNYEWNVHRVQYVG